MTKQVRFTKMHGAGNDYIYVDTSKYPIEHPETAAVAWSAPHTGIGSDGLVLIGRSQMPEADFTMRIFNADGSEAMMCGNASRCIGKYVYERGLTQKTEVRLLTMSGVKTLRLHIDTTDNTVDSVTVDMLAPQLENRSQFLPDAQDLPQGTFVCMGNPHYVIFTDDISQVDVAREGQRLEHHSAFPQRCNIEFAQVLPDGTIRTRVWERGSGITQACGTGACATAVAACLTRRSGRQSVIQMDGGTLRIDWQASDNHVLMTGPAAFVFDGEATLSEA